VRSFPSGEPAENERGALVQSKVAAGLVTLLTGGALLLGSAGAASGYELATWGSNGFGQLGNGSPVEAGRLRPNEVPATVIGVSEVTSAAAGPGHTLALVAGGTVFAWGANDNGQLGNNTITGPYQCEPEFAVSSYCNPNPAQVPSLSGVTAVAAGGEQHAYSEFSLALLSGGSIVGWGANERGQLGNGTTTPSKTPVAVASGVGAASAIAAGPNNAYALLQTGNVVAWGAGGEGQLGDGESAGSDKPVQVKLTGAIAIAPEIALLSGHTVVDWGPGANGKLGNGNTVSSNQPTAVSGLTSVNAVAAGTGFNLALRSDGTVWGWGVNDADELGSASGPETCSGTPCSRTPVRIPGVSGARAIAAGGSKGYALLNDGSVVSWGDGQETPTPVCGLREVSGIAAAPGWALAYGPSHTLCPTVTSLSPDHGPGAGKTQVTITGTGFTEAKAVEFGSASARFTTTSSTSITATAPSGTVGPVAVTVTTPVGKSVVVPASEYTYEVGPVLTRVAPHQGPPSGGASVTIIGANFTKVTAVDFGETPASKFKVENANLIKATAPAGTGTTHIRVLNAEGTTVASPESRFTYAAQEAPEFGVCKKQKKGHFSDAGCTAAVSENGSYEWIPGPSKSRFSISAFEPVLQAAPWGNGSSVDIQCTSMKGQGEFAGTKEIAGTTLVFSGCHWPVAMSMCGNGSRAGEIRMTEVEGILGWQNKATRQVALALGPELLAAGGQTNFACYFSMTLSGSVLAPVPVDATMSKTPLEYHASEGQQEVGHFEGQPGQQLAIDLNEGETPFPIGLTMSAQLKGGKLEVNAVK
jgi:alpha-tubulin suppressor-like RCC1 family protein